MAFRYLLLSLAAAAATAASAQPTWRFHLAFEDGVGARDTIWMVYDITATTGTFPYPGPNVDTLLGEGPVMVNDGLFHVFLTNVLGDTTRTNAYPYSVYPSFDGNIIDAINWVPPMTISWDTSLFHAPYLPYDQGHFGIAIMDGIAFSQFDQSGSFGVFNMLIDDSVTVDFLWDYLFTFSVYFGAVDDTGISAEQADAAPLSLAPNPAKEQVQVRGLGHAVCTFRLMDAMGREVLRQGAVKEGSTIPLTTVAPGAYVYELMPVTGAVLRGRLVVQR